MRLVHTPEPDTIAPLPVRRQRRSEGLEVMEADHASTTMRLVYTLGLDILAGGTLSTDNYPSQGVSVGT
jgi:hypothetical protein